MPPEISVIIPTFNVERYLAKTIESVLSLDLESLEIIIIDDGSTDQSYSIAEKYSELYPNKVSLHRHANSGNRGVSASRNLGISNSKGQFIAFLDGDDRYNRNRFNKSLQMLKQDNSIDAVYERCDFAAIHEKSDDWSACEPFGIQNPLVGKELLASLIRGIPWHTSAVLARRSLLEKTGNFDESISIAEDCHLWMRMAVVGNVLPGEFSEPVSWYCRRAGSLYKPSIQRKWDYWIAIKKFIDWLRYQKSCNHSYQDVYQLANGWLENSIVECRKQGANSLARRLIIDSYFSKIADGTRLRLISHFLRTLTPKSQ